YREFHGDPELPVVVVQIAGPTAYPRETPGPQPGRRSDTLSGQPPPGGRGRRGTRRAGGAACWRTLAGCSAGQRQRRSGHRDTPVRLGGRDRGALPGCHRGGQGAPAPRLDGPSAPVSARLRGPISMIT